MSDRLKPYTPGRCFVCGHPCARQFLMCRPHWRMVPRDLQRAIYDTTIREPDGQAVREEAAIIVLNKLDRATAGPWA